MNSETLCTCTISVRQNCTDYATTDYATQQAMGDPYRDFVETKGNKGVLFGRLTLDTRYNPKPTVEREPTYSVVAYILALQACNCLN